MASNDLELALRIRAAFEGQQALTNLATSFVDINKKVETLMRGLQAISGSAEGAAKEFTYLEETAKKFGLSVIDLSDNYVKLAASSRETNLEGEATRKIFEATASTMAVLGGDTVTTERAFRALGQIMSKGQVYAEELKGQLAEAIPGALQIMSRGLGISTNEMLRLMEAGQLSADVLLPFATQLEKEYGNLASSSTTFAQAINRIQTEWTLLMKRLGDTGAWSALSGAMNLVGKHSELIAGAIGVGLVAASVKAISVTKGLAVSIIDSVRSFQLQGTAAEVAAKAVLDKANADALAATRAVQSAEASSASARASLLSATTAANATNASVAAQERLVAATIRNQLASEGLSAAKIKETEALITANLAANNYAKSQSVMSRSMALLTGPAGMIALIIAGFAAMAYAFRGQDEANKILAKSTEEYTEALKGMNAEQLESVALSSAKQIKAIDDKIDAYHRQLGVINDVTDGTYKYVSAEGGLLLTIPRLLSSLSFLGDEEKNRKNILIELAKLENERDILAGKSASGIDELSNKYHELNTYNKKYADDLSVIDTAIREQVKVIYSAKQANIELKESHGELSKESLDGTRRVGESVEKLNQLELERSNRLLLLEGNQKSLNSIVNAYSKVTGFSVDAVMAGISGDQQAIDKLDAKSRAIALSVQSLLRLTDEEKALAAQVKLTRSELEKYEKVQLSGVDAKLREATAIGDLNAIRQAEIEKAKVQQSVAQQSLALEQTILSDKKKQLAIDEQIYQQNEKGRPKTQERIDKLKLEITAQEGVIAQKKADVAATAAQAAATERANTLIGKALAQQQQSLSNTQNELAELQATYERLSASGESITVLNGLLEQMRKKQADVAQQTDTMRANMIAAFAAVGLSYEEVMTGMDFETRRQIDAFGALGDQANVTSGDIQNAFTNILAKANTVSELDELARTLKSLGANGKASGDQVAVGLAAIDLKAAELINSLDPVQQSLEKLGIGVPERLEAIAQQNEVLYDIIKKSKAPIDEVDKAFLKYAESQLLAAEHGAKIDAAALKNEASTRGLSAAFAELQRKMAETDPEIAALVESADRYNKIVQRTNALNEQQREVNKQVIESQKVIAEIIGDKNKVAEEEAKLAAQAVQDSIQRINDIEEEKDAIDGLIKKLIEKQKAEGLNPEETDSLKQYQDEAQAKQLLIDKANEELLLKKKIAEQAAIDAGPLGQAVRAAQEHASAINNKVIALEKELEIKLKLQQQEVTDEQQKLRGLESDKELLGVTKEGLEAELAKAIAEKDVDEQNEIRLKIADNLIKQAEKEIEIAEQKVRVAKELVEMSEAEQQAAIKKAKAYREAAAAQERLMEAERAKMEASDGLNQEEKEQLANMAARIAGLKSQAISEDAAADAAAASIEQGKKQVAIAEKGVEVAKKRVEALKEEKEVLEDSIRSQDNDTKSKDKNSESTKKNTSTKEDAKQASEDLAKAQEEAKKAAEEEAKAQEEAKKAIEEKMQVQKEAAEEARKEAESLKADLLKETGFDQEADLLSQSIEYQSKKLELEKSIKAAQADGNKALVAALNEQLGLLNKINSVKVQNINDQYAQEQADRELEATQKIADATQQLTDIIDAAAQERLDIEADHLKSIDQLHEQANADRLAKIQQNKLDQENADDEYGQARKDQEQATNKEILSLRDEHQKSLIDLEKDYQSSVINEQADLTQSLESVNQESANSIKRLYEDSANSINEINQDIAKELNDVTDNLSKDLVGVTEGLSKDLLGVTKDLTQDLNDLTNDLAKDLEDISKELVSSMEDAAKELDRDFFTSDRDNARKIEELYRDLDRSIADQQRDTQAELLSLEKDRADKISKIRKDAAESARNDNKRIDQEELNDKIKSIQEEFSEKKRRTVEESKLKIAEDRQDAAVKESDLIEDLAYKKQLLQEEYELERIELAQLAEEKRIEAKRLAEEERVALEQKAEERRVALEQEAADRRVILEQEAADRKAEIASEKTQRLQALQEELLVKKQLLAEELKEAQSNLNSQSQLRFAKLSEEYALNKAEAQQQLSDTIAELNRESEEKIAVLSKEHEAKRQLLQAEQTLDLRSINDTYQAELLLLNQQTQAELAEAKKKADQSVLLAQENIQTIQQQIEFELSLARAKDAQAESQVRLNYSMKETLALTNQIKEGLAGLSQSNLSGLIAQAGQLNASLKAIDQVL